MAADDFTLIPTWVKPLPSKFYNVVTKSESGKKEYQNISTTPTKQFELKFQGLSDTDYDSLRAHYEARYGGYDSFSWQSVPSYIESGANMTGRWKDKSLKAKARATCWDVTIIFEKDT